MITKENVASVSEEVERILAGLDERDKVILRCSREEFAAHGYHDASVDRMAVAAGLGKGTIYRRFRSKQILFLVTVLRGHMSLTKEILSVDNSLPFRERLHERLNVIARFIAKNLDILRLMLHEQSKIIEGISVDELHKLKNPLQEAQAGFWRQLLDDAIAEGSLAKDTDVAMTASMLAGILRGIYSELFFTFVHPEGDTLNEDVIEKWNTLALKVLFEGVFARPIGQQAG